MTTPPLRDRLSGGEAVYGGWSTIPDVLGVRALATAGLDYVVVDLQHGGATERDLPALTMAIRQAGATPMGRVRHAHPADIGRALDLGCDGVIVPNVESAQQALAVTGACRYPPVGYRSAGGTIAVAEPLTAAWPVITVDSLTAASARALLDNEIAAIRYPRFVDPAACRQTAARLLASEHWGYYEGVQPRQGRLGITQYEHHGDPGSYFAAAPAATGARRQVLDGLPDPLELLRAGLAAVWDAPVTIAAEDRGGYFAGVFRSGSGARLHADWGPRDGPGWVIGGNRAQIAWTVYYTVPPAGGDLVVIDRPWSPGLEAAARQRFNDYDPDLLAGLDRAQIRIRPGDLVLFSASNVHAVTEAPGGGDRLSLSSFIGERADGSLIFWS